MQHFYQVSAFKTEERFVYAYNVAEKNSKAVSVTSPQLSNNLSVPIIGRLLAPPCLMVVIGV